MIMRLLSSLKTGLFIFTSLFLVAFLANDTLAAMEVCPDQNPDCCTAPVSVTNGGGCPGSQVWIGDVVSGYCQEPAQCIAGEVFQCATNTCDPGGNVCGTTGVQTDICCGAGQVPVRDLGSITGWTCGDGGGGGGSPWEEDAFGLFVLDKQVGIGQNTAVSNYSLAVKSDGNNAATLGAITTDASLVGSVGISATGDRAGGIFSGVNAALEAIGGGEILAISDSIQGAGTVVGFLQGLGGGSNEVRLGGKSDHNVSIQRNDIAFIDLVVNGLKEYIHFPTGTETFSNVAETGYLLVGDVAGRHVSIDSDAIFAKTNGTTAGTLYLNPDGAVIVNPNVNSADNLCVDGFGRIANCASSLRYKENIRPLSSLLEESALSTLQELRPVVFDWIEGAKDDFGLVAEEVATVFPEAATYNRQGQIQGVKYDQLVTVAIQAIREQQVIIEAQQQQLDQLKALVCLDSSEANLCKK